MKVISTELIKEAIYKLCFEANTCLDDRVYSKILDAYNKTNDEILKSILQNAKVAYDKKLPLCQDTGQVIVFVEIGQDVHLTGELLETAINSSVKKCYIENFFRKSVVKNSIFDRTNTQDNTPAIIYTKIIEGDFINLSVLIKGAGSENKSKLEMMLPTSSKEEIIDKCSELIISAGKNACPPMFIGIGIGGTADKAILLSKQVFVKETFSTEEYDLSERIKNKVNEQTAQNYVLDIKTYTTSTHIACMPVAITINCHSDRTSSCTITENSIEYNHKTPDFIEFDNISNQKQEIFSNEIEKLRNLKQGEEILLSGKIYIARDMAHKKLKEMLDNGETLPFNIENSIIFYAGPCPNKEGGIIGSVGPTTASRMDKYAIDLYNKGLLATIGKGERSPKVQEAITKNNAKYFTITGGIAALLSDKVKKKEIIVFEELGAEALYFIEVDKLPVKVEII